MENETPKPAPLRPWNWRDALTDRELKELHFAIAYAMHYNHGTDGHGRLLLIAKLCQLLDTTGE